MEERRRQNEWKENGKRIVASYFVSRDVFILAGSQSGLYKSNLILISALFTVRIHQIWWYQIFLFSRLTIHI